MKTELDPTSWLLYWWYILRKDYLNLLSCREWSALPLRHNLPMNNNCLPKLLCFLPPAFFFSGLYIFSQDCIKYWNHCEGWFFDNISVPIQGGKKKKKWERNWVRLIWEFYCLVFSFTHGVLIISWTTTKQDFSWIRTFRFLETGLVLIQEHSNTYIFLLLILYQLIDMSFTEILSFPVDFIQTLDNMALQQRYVTLDIRICSLSSK